MKLLLARMGSVTIREARRTLAAPTPFVSDGHHRVEGDDPADAARYGLVSGARFAGLHDGFGSCRGTIYRAPTYFAPALRYWARRFLPMLYAAPPPTSAT